MTALQPQLDLHDPPPSGGVGAATVATGARLHLGFLDLNGELGRRFGSLGLAIDGFRTRLTAVPADRISASGPSARRVERCAARVLEAWGVRSGCHVTVHEAIPSHLGLGSGTQLDLAVGAAVARLHGMDVDAAAVAGVAHRGVRSGIGIGSFDQGGFIVDGGRGPGDTTPPVVSRLMFPQAWRVVLVLAGDGEGLHGQGEVEAFKGLPPFPTEQAAHLCRLTLMQILPAVAEGRLEPFARGVAEVQRMVGDHFAPAQGGRYASAAVAALLEWAEARGHPGVGQSSWGPTGFILAASQAEAEELVAAAHRRFGTDLAVRLRIVKGCNHGSIVTTTTAPKEGLKSAP